ncbi:transcriptional regulator, TetR family [Marinospirillum celere]|uniref:Transcriptional regulator, TetR family n=1 Tax=Marinospirillum celere TaxID=1122252 RepID=A0A1I1GBS1_9GAMM|nr:TetR/AcrR family transcriptional regulator [Marinospirillum celere]SFC06620.1 transcriptional regulator, TetR family [Marinospirillum celere]
MTKARRRNNSANAILDAAQRVAVAKGANKVSLDSVAKEAGLTKGGVLYNFPSKDALISGLLLRLLKAYGPLIDESVEQLEGQAHPHLRSVFRVISQLQELDHNIPMAILAAAAENLELLQPLRDEMAQRYQRIQAEAPSGDAAALLWAAGEGLMLLDMLKLLPFGAEEKTRLLEKLDEKAGGLK